MTRLASTAKAGFFPTPERVTEWIARYVIPSKAKGKILDPCCGEGIAVQYVANAWQLESFGIEIDAERALEASSRLHRVLHLDYACVRAPHHAFQVLFENPPYDAPEGEGRRTCNFTHNFAAAAKLCFQSRSHFSQPKSRNAACHAAMPLTCRINPGALRNSATR